MDNMKHEAGLLAVQQGRWPVSHPGCGLSRSIRHFLPAPRIGVSFQTKAQCAGARGHAGRVPAQSQDAVGAYAGGRGRRTSCPMYLPAGADAAREISHPKITRRHKYFADSIGSRWLESVGLLT